MLYSLLLIQSSGCSIGPRVIMNSAIRMGESSLRDREVLECILLVVSMLAIEHVCYVLLYGGTG